MEDIQATISVNGGPEVPFDMLHKAVGIVAKKAAQEQFPNLKEFFAEIDRHEDERSAINTEINECFDSYSSSTGTDKDALKLAYKLYKAINKDKTKAEAMQFEYDKMADLLITDKEQPSLFDRGEL